MADAAETTTARWPAWRKIEDAPRDGTTIFGYAFRRGQRGLVHWNGNEWEMVNGLTNFPNGRTFNPTHWLPLPEPPYAE